MTTPTSPMELHHQRVMRKLRVASSITRALPFVLLVALAVIMIINGGQHA